VFLVDDQQPESLEAHVSLKKTMRPDNNVDLPCLQTFDGSRLRLVIDESREHLDCDRELAQALPKDVEMLLGKNSRRG
jgi:hypothetical protein